jgi:hypothetical protein
VWQRRSKWRSVREAHGKAVPVEYRVTRINTRGGGGWGGGGGGGGGS